VIPTSCVRGKFTEGHCDTAKGVESWTRDRGDYTEDDEADPFISLFLLRLLVF